MAHGALLIRTARLAVIVGGLVLLFKIGQAIYTSAVYSWAQQVAIQNGSHLPPLWQTLVQMAADWLSLLAMVAAPYVVYRSNRAPNSGDANEVAELESPELRPLD